ncbi:hypothetical protein SAMN04515668_4337 [Hymenobacter arizonensis]|uniref:Uncharacterized protein n=1 Tax=Hymenobacter arizonensis TaxID=1227077 RepID=A0A1I6BA01_HYMAR|nr:hypothetical protein SAMN04515668_4337 [Hymenobacter arizonensis]
MEHVQSEDIGFYFLKLYAQLEILTVYTNGLGLQWHCHRMDSGSKGWNQDNLFTARNYPRIVFFHCYCQLGKVPVRLVYFPSFLVQG